MSTDKDDLKKLFTQAFEAEEIPFDMHEWEKMEQMLNRRRRRRFFIFWFSGAALLGILGAAFWSESPDKVYSPRLVSSIDLNRNTDMNFDAANVANAMSDVISNAESLRITANKPSKEKGKNELPKDSQSKTYVTTLEDVASISRIGVPKVEVQENTAPESQQTEVELGSEPLYSHEESDLERAQILIDFMPPLSATMGQYSLAEKNVEESESKMKYDPRWYIQAGVTSVRFIFTKQTTIRKRGFGAGQLLGLGYSKQVHPKWLISAEIRSVRETVLDTARIPIANTYGYSEQKNFSEVQTSELLYTELPLLAHYRMNRVSVGAGLSLGYLMGLRNAVVVHSKSGSYSITEPMDTRYYRWDRYQNIHAAALADVQYQWLDRIFIGGRTNLGLSRILTVDHRNMNKARFDVYLKYIMK